MCERVHLFLWALTFVVEMCVQPKCLTGCQIPRHVYAENKKKRQNTWKSWAGVLRQNTIRRELVTLECNIWWNGSEDAHHATVCAVPRQWHYELSCGKFWRGIQKFRPWLVVSPVGVLYGGDEKQTPADAVGAWGMVLLFAAKVMVPLGPRLPFSRIISSVPNLITMRAAIRKSSSTCWLNWSKATEDNDQGWIKLGIIGVIGICFNIKSS